MRKTKNGKRVDSSGNLMSVYESEVIEALGAKSYLSQLEEGFVPVRELAKKLNMHPESLYKLAKDNDKIEQKKFKLPGWKCPKMCYRVRKS